MKKNKFKPELLNEELKKFKLLYEYNFYTGEEVAHGYETDKPVILGDESGAFMSEADEDANTDDATDAIASDLGLEPSDDTTAGDNEETGDLPDETPEEEDITPDETPEEEPVADDSNDIEVDVTSLVKGSEEAKAAADKATANTEALLQKLTDLESKIASMDAISAKINNLEQEIVKRNPTPVEKLEMRSLSSYPYSQKLTDYWADKQGAYDVMGTGDEKKEYVLTQNDVDQDYSEPQIKQSFGVNPDEYEEEEI